MVRPYSEGLRLLPSELLSRRLDAPQNTGARVAPGRRGFALEISRRAVDPVFQFLLFFPAIQRQLLLDTLTRCPIWMARNKHMA